MCPAPSSLVHFPAPESAQSDRPHASLWGFADSEFVVESDAIVLRSSRYANGGRPLTQFAPFVKHAVGVAFDPNDRHEFVTPKVPPALQCADLVAELRAILGEQRCTQEDAVRLRHGHGHHLEEVYEVLYGALKRVPDVVVYPENADEIAQLLEIAQRHRAQLIPFGGGTSVSMALHCIASERAIVSVDLARMNRILWLDPETQTACIQAGAVGRVIEQQLQEAGYTLGHEPDSIEFSTLGGWIATNASGMKKNRYGNIEDIVLDLSVVTPRGEVERLSAQPRTSHGIDVRRLLFGSEGLLGVITEAVVRVHKRPEVQHYGSLVFPTWQAGLSFMRQLSTRQTVPASVRLVDNLQFQFGRALKPQSGSVWAAKLQKLYVSKIKGIDLSQLVACTLVYEGHADEQAALKRQVEQLAKQYGGFGAGDAAGKDGYNLTFGIAYIRDFLLRYWTMGDSFETAVPWDKVNDVISAVRSAVVEAHAEQKLLGHPFVTSRVSQIYTSGCCVYFYIGFHYKAVTDPLAAFKHIEHAARVAILEAGGALSHHHGVGKLRAPYLNHIKGATAQSWMRDIASKLDPEGIFLTGNQGLSDEPSAGPRAKTSS